MTYAAFKKGDKVDWFGFLAVVLEDSPADCDVIKVEESKNGLVCEWDKVYMGIPVVLDENA